MKKGYIKTLVVFFFFFFMSLTVNAEVISIDKLAEELHKASVISFMEQNNEIKINIEVDKVNKKLKITPPEMETKSYSFGLDYIEYDNRSFVVTKDNVDENMFDAMWLSDIMETIIRLSGKEGMTLDDHDFTNTYNTYGFQSEIEPYNFHTENEYGTSTTKGSVIKYIKMSLDTNKIQKLIDNYGISAEEKRLRDLTPTIEVAKANYNSITLTTFLSGMNENNSASCYIYRSTSENGTYEKINNVAIPCNREEGFTDNNLQSNTTYYYKAIVDGGVNYSNVISAKTENASASPIPKNPDTGINLPTITLILATILGILIISYTNRKKLFHKI